MHDKQDGRRAEARREARARRELKKLDLTLRKDRSRTWSLDRQGGYMIYDPFMPNVILGTRYELSLGDVGHWLGE